MNAKEAYQAIATSLVQASDDGWERLEAVCPILQEGLGGVETRQVFNGSSRDLPIGFAVFDLQRACLALRDDLIAAGKARIWGLTFTLYPDGRHEIEYDYVKPEGYEETDEVMTGDEINQSLTGQRPAAPPAMTVEQAYQAIGRCVLHAQGDSAWTRSGVDMDYKPGRQVLMRFWQETDSGRQKAPYVPEQQVMVEAADAAYALYEHLGRGGGDTPSGLSMSLTPEGKMKLEYRYPE